MKIIKIRTCYDCPYMTEDVTYGNFNRYYECEYWCDKLQKNIGYAYWKKAQNGSILDETVWDGVIPDDCPLENDNA